MWSLGMRPSVSKVSCALAAVIFKTFAAFQANAAEVEPSELSAPSQAWCCHDPPFVKTTGRERPADAQCKLYKLVTERFFDGDKARNFNAQQTFLCRKWAGDAPLIRIEDKKTSQQMALNGCSSLLTHLENQLVWVDPIRKGEGGAQVSFQLRFLLNEGQQLRINRLLVLLPLLRQLVLLQTTSKLRSR